MASFSVVAIVKEDESILRQFCNEYIRLGAKEIFVYYDGPTEEIGKDGFFDRNDAISLVACDTAFWENHSGERPGRLRDRQVAVYQIAYSRCQSDWLLVCDADEFILADMPLGLWLDRVPAAVDSVNFPTAEAVWGPGQAIDVPFETNLFRLPFKDQRQWKRSRLFLYGPIGRVMDKGLASHSHGKSITRTGLRDITVGTHEAERDGKECSVLVSELGLDCPMVYLAHFDAISFQRWQVKFERRAPKFKEDGGTGSKKRKRQARLANFAAALGALPSRMVFRSLYCLSKRQEKQLSRQDLLIKSDVLFG